MDLDSFTAVHTEQWNRLEELTGRRRPTGAEADELVVLYQRVATQLSQVRSAAPDPALITRLSILLASARSRISAGHGVGWSDVARFFAVVLPVALYRIRWWAVGVSGACLLLAVIAGVWVDTNPDALASMGTPMEQQRYVQEQFAAYYSQYPAPSFSAQVWTNNAWISAQCIAMGITGVWPAMVLFQNSVSIGATGGMMIHHDAAWPFFALILPHGLLELSAVFVAGAAGLHIFWTLLVPGPRPRGRALKEEGLSTFTVAIGLTIALAVSGVIEGFVTPSGWPDWLRLGIGAAACAAAWVYVFVPGRRALRKGQDADLRPGQAEDTVAIAA